MRYLRPQTLGLRLFLAFLALVLSGMAVVIPLAWLAVERLYLSSQQANLLAQAKELAFGLAASPPSTGEPDPYSQLSNVQPGVRSRLVQAQGNNALVLDLGAPTGPDLPDPAIGLVSPQELLSRSEMVSAQAGQAATAVRSIPAAGGRRVLYAAVPVPAAGGVAQVVYLATPLPDTRWSALPVGMRLQFSAVLLAAASFAAAAGWLIARRIARPLDSLAGAAQAVAAGDLDQAVPVDPGIAELAALGRSFNTMTAGLRAAEQAKNAFIADVSHELRTPLTVIKGTIETLQDGAIDDPPARERFLEGMGRETERLIRLVNDLLVLTRADAGALNLQPEAVDLLELARLRCAYLERAAVPRGVSFQVIDETGGAPCTVWVDPDRLAQALDNLLDNAARYSPPGGQVRVAVARERDEVACRVSDGGPGIPPEHLPRIFERFYRADPARGRSRGGSGLGLAIVRGLLEAHGGRVAASSPPGQGAAFTIWLPAYLAEADPLAPLSPGVLYRQNWDRGRGHRR